MTWIWLFILIALVFLEAITIKLVTIWYIASAFVSLILSFVIDSYMIQFLVFVILGTLLLLVTRKYLSERLNCDDIMINLNKVVKVENSKTKKSKVSGKK